MSTKESIILFGFGTLGQHLYKYLHHAGYRIRVICQDKEKIQSDIVQKIDIKNIDLKKNEEILALQIDPKYHILYCALNKTVHNLFLILTLRTLYPQSQIIAISDSTENIRKLKYVGANHVIDLYEATAKHISNNLTKPAITRAIDEIIYHRNNIRITEVQIPEYSFLAGKHISEIDFKKQGLILLAIKDREISNKTMIIDKSIDHKIDSGDILIIVGREEDINHFQKRV